MTETSSTIVANGTIVQGDGRLFVGNSVLNAEAIQGGWIILREKGYVNLSSNNPLANNKQINFTHPLSWLKLTAQSVSSFNEQASSNLLVRGLAPESEVISVDAYYSAGTIVRFKDNLARPLTIYQGIDFLGTNSSLEVGSVYTGTQIPTNLEDNISSLKLSKGYMATLAENSDGTGIGKVFIAVEEDLELTELPDNMLNNVSFIRVLPWHYISKKGVGGNRAGMNNAWFYNWGNGSSSTQEIQYTPMAWGKGAAINQTAFDRYFEKKKSNHLLAFNEPDDCGAQSGQFGNLCIEDTAVEAYQNLMQTGLRMVSPSGREEAPFGWLKNFYDGATERNFRIDVIGVHWYDWGSSPRNASTNDSPSAIFTRFKNYLERVHNLYNLPIWITEFNGNRYRSTEANLGFMQLALPYLESLDYVERYAWFEPFGDSASFYTEAGNYTSVGEAYRDHISSPSISEANYLAPNNLDEKSEIITGYQSEVVSEEHFVYPNPVKDVLTIEMYTAWSLFTISGQLIKEGEGSTINVSSLNSGLYLLRFDNKIMKVVKK